MGSRLVRWILVLSSLSNNIKSEVFTGFHVDDWLGGGFDA